MIFKRSFRLYISVLIIISLILPYRTYGSETENHENIKSISSNKTALSNTLTPVNNTSSANSISPTPYLTPTDKQGETSAENNYTPDKAELPWDTEWTTTWQNDFSFSQKADQYFNGWLELNKYNGNEEDLSVPVFAYKKKPQVPVAGYTYNFQSSFPEKIDGLFSDNKALKTVDLSKVFAGHVNIIHSMFNGCSNLTKIDMSFDFTEIREDNEKIILNLRPEIIEKRKNREIEVTGNIFEGCDRLKEIKIPKNLNGNIKLPGTFVKEDDPTKEYTYLPKKEAESFTIIKKDEHVPVKEIVSEEKNNEKELEDGEEDYIKYRIVPSNATDQVIVWESSDPDIVTVDVNGKIKGISPGKAVITGTTEDGGYVLRIVITVKYIKITGFTIDQTSKIIGLPGTFIIVLSILPWNASDKDVIWSSDNENVAIVDQTGKVTTTGYGETYIRVKTKDGKFVQSCKVSVIEGYIPVKDVTLTPKDTELNVGGSTDIRSLITPSDATDQTLIWYSNDEKIAKVSNTGHVTAIAPGKVIIYVRASNGVVYYCEITVIKVIIPVTGIMISPDTKTLYVNSGFRITYIISPINADDRSVTFISSDPTVAAVDKYGNVMALKNGTATITVTTNDGGYTAVCVIYVTDPPPPSPAYTLYVLDYRNNALYKNLVKARSESLPGDRYLIIRDSDGYILRPLIYGDGTLNYYLTILYYNLRYTDVNGNDKSDHGRCTVRIPLGTEMDLNRGTLMVVGLKDNKLNKSIPFMTGYENGIPYVTITVENFGEIAVLYNPKNSFNIFDGTQQNNYPGLPGVQNNLFGTTRILDSIPKTGYGYNCFDRLKERYEYRIR